jgi:hypothetical protein
MNVILLSTNTPIIIPVNATLLSIILVEVHTDNGLPPSVLSGRVSVLALEIGEFHSRGNHQRCGYGSMTRPDDYKIILNCVRKIDEK